MRRDSGHRLRVVLMSGYSVEEVASQSSGQEIGALVQKPVRRAALLGALRQALGR